jgi:D-amino-acid dehydrogenase
VRGIIRSALAYFPALKEADFAGVEPWKGLRPCSPDGLPYLGRTARYDNLVIATGHAMMGLSLAPITGRLVGQLVAGERPEHDLTLLSPDRFG